MQVVRLSSALRATCLNFLAGVNWTWVHAAIERNKLRRLGSKWKVTELYSKFRKESIGCSVLKYLKMLYWGESGFQASNQNKFSVLFLLLLSLSNNCQVPAPVCTIVGHSPSGTLNDEVKAEPLHCTAMARVQSGRRWLWRCPSQVLGRCSLPPSPPLHPSNLLLSLAPRTLLHSLPTTHCKPRAKLCLASRGRF